MTLHEQALEKEDQLIAVENTSPEKVEALEELGMRRVTARQGRLVRQEFLPREVGPSPLEEGRLGGGGLDGELGHHAGPAILGHELGGIELVAAGRTDGLERHDAVDGRAADLPLLLLGSGLGGPEGDGISAGPVQGGTVGGTGAPVPPADRSLPAGHAVDGLLGGVGPLPRLGDLGHLLELGLGLSLDGIGEEVGEVLEEVGMVSEQGRHLVKDVLDAPLLLLVRVKDLQKLLVRFGFGGKTLLDGGNVVNGMIELDGLLRSTATLLLLLLRWRRSGGRSSTHRGLRRRRRTTGRTALLHRRSPSDRWLGTCRRSRLLTCGVAGRWSSWSPLRRRLLLLRCSHSSSTTTTAGSGCTSHCTSRSTTSSTAGGRLLGRRTLRMAGPKDVRHPGLAGTAIHGKDLAGLVAGELDLVPLGQEGVESQHQALVALEQIGNPPDDAGGVDLLRLERLHDVEELVVDVRPVTELHLDLIEVHEGVLDAQFAHHGGKGGGSGALVFDWGVKRTVLRVLGMMDIRLYALSCLSRCAESKTLIEGQMPTGKIYPQKLPPIQEDIAKEDE